MTEPLASGAGHEPQLLRLLKLLGLGERATQLDLRTRRRGRGVRTDSGALRDSSVPRSVRERQPRDRGPRLGRQAVP
jgi:hypothetical protein